MTYSKFNQQLLEFKDSTYKQKTLTNIYKAILDERMRVLKNKVNNSPIAQIIVRKFDDKDCIRAVGASIPTDLINDNFGYLLASMFRAPAATNLFFTMTDDSNTLDTFGSYVDSSVYSSIIASSSSGTKIRVGSGVTAVARNDYTIQTPLSTSPENTYFNTGFGGYSSAGRVIQTTGTFNAGAAETIKETGLFGAFTKYTGGAVNVMLSHENISPTVPFLLGDPISVKYVWSI